MPDQPVPEGILDIPDALKSLANERNSVVVSVVAERRPISDAQAISVWLRLAKYGTQPKVDLVIHSNGGIINAAYSIVETLRRGCASLTAFVPVRAMSASTLLCLGADEIVMGNLAQLGPLDTQVYEDRKGGDYRYNSALNPLKALEQLRDFSLMSLRLTKTALVNDGVLPDEAYEIAANFVSATTPPLYSQLNPEKIGEYSRALAISERYAKVLLKRYSKLPQVERDKLVQQLVFGYPAHDYVIDIGEATDLRLPVRAAAASAEGALVIAFLWAVSQNSLKDQVTVVASDEIENAMNRNRNQRQSVAPSRRPGAAATARKKTSPPRRARRKPGTQVLAVHSNGKKSP